MLCHETLENHYRLNFQLMHFHKYSLAELENMFPFERELYMNLIMEDIARQEEEQKQLRGI